MIEKQVTKIKFVVINKTEFEKSVQWKILLSIVESYILLCNFQDF